MHFVKREGKLFIRVFPDKPISKKPLETRMGTGKAEVEYWAARVKPGTMLFEMAGVSETVATPGPARVAMQDAGRTRLIGRAVNV
jgi:large subunit ribosomal protein L16